MATKTINVDVLAKMFLAGAQNIEAKKDYINELNVFPVPDGDTGTNMSMTIMSAAKEVTALNKPAMKDLAKAISSGSLRGARGNSGVILSQLLRGFTKAIKEEKEIDVLALAAACQRARDTAYKAIQVRERLSNELNREPKVEEIAKELDINKEDVVIALEAIVEPVSLYEPVYNEGGDAIYVMDQIGDRNTPDSWMDEIMIRDSIKRLSQREKNILNLRFMLGKTQTEVAKEIGISQAQVSRLEKSALKRIKGQ